MNYSASYSLSWLDQYVKDDFHQRRTLFFSLQSWESSQNNWTAVLAIWDFSFNLTVLSAKTTAFDCHDWFSHGSSSLLPRTDRDRTIQKKRCSNAFFFYLPCRVFKKCNLRPLQIPSNWRTVVATEAVNAVSSGAVSLLAHWNLPWPWPWFVGAGGGQPEAWR